MSDKTAKGTDYRWIGKRPVRHDGVDKVTGRAQYGADFDLPGMLYGRALRSPVAHGVIKSIDTSAARALDGVKDVITGADLPEVSSEGQIEGEAPASVRDTAHNVIARRKVHYHGHTVAAVAATSPSIAEEALKLIKVEIESLPVVLDVMEACSPDAPLIEEHQHTNGDTGSPPSNIASTNTFEDGDLEQGFEEADVIVEHEFDSGTVHQGYIETHACMAEAKENGEITLWVSSQGHFSIRDATAQVLAIEPSRIKAIAAEIGGGFGGKTTVYLEPLAVLMAQRTGQPVKMVMTRDEVFRGTGPAPGSHTRIRMGATSDGRITAVDCDLWFEAGGYPGSAVGAAMMALIAPYDVKNFRIVGYDVLVNKPKSHAYRAPGAPNAAHASEVVIDEICEQIGMDPLEFRLKNAARKGTKAPYGPVFPEIGMVETVQAALEHPHYQAPLGANQGRGRGVRLLDERRRRRYRASFGAAGRQGDAGHRTARHRRLARRPRHGGGGRVADRRERRAAVDRRHRLDRLQRRHRRQQYRLLRRGGGIRGGAQADRRRQAAGRGDLGSEGRRRGVA